MKIASWNVNSINARLATALEVIDRLDADVICLQEIKCMTGKFPVEPFEEAGYTCVVHGQKSYNGVAILSRHPIEDAYRGLAGIDPEQARYIEALVVAEKPVRVASIYVPNGNPAPGPKYDAKLAFMRALTERAQHLLTEEEPVALVGDYNCIPRDEDCWDPESWAEDALALPDTRAAFRRLCWLGFTEAFEACDGGGGAYTFWDYQAGSWSKDHGVRIDHLLLSPQAADMLLSVRIDREARGMTKPSDHVPVICELDI